MIFLLAGLLALAGVAAPVRAAESPIRWEISNRFAPFEVLSDPAAVFQAYRLNPGESWADWHVRKWREMGPGFASPYARALASRGPLPWDKARQGLSEALLPYLREENSPQTTVSVRLWVDDDRRCVWHYAGNLAPVAQCSDPLEIRVPLSGLDVAVHFPSVGGQPARPSEGLRIAPRHMVIVGLGDSYGTGEGNPDMPTVWRPALAPEAGDVNWLVTGSNIRRAPAWLSPRCHRSFFSQQSLTALGIAARDPHVFVSFLHYACSGAEVFKGLLVPQEDPPGGRGFNHFSQLNAARRDLCRDPGPRLRYQPLAATWPGGPSLRDFARRNGAELRPGSNLDWQLRRSEGGSDAFPREGLLDCPEGALRAPDLVLLSIGGNDVGFGELVRYFVAPIARTSALGTSLLLPDLCPDPRYRADPSYAPHAAAYCAGRDARLGYDVGDLIGSAGDKGGIGARLALTMRALRDGLEVSARQIVMSHYPDPLRRTEHGHDPCWRVGAARDVVGQPLVDPQSPWNGLKAADPTRLFADNTFTLVEDEADKLLSQFDDLRFQVTLASRREGFRLACGARDVMVGRGYWAGRDLALPSDAGGWPPYRWQPYRAEAGGRMVRTGNDSLLTQGDGGAAIEGTAHPNLAGHAGIADQVLARIFGDEDTRRARDLLALSPAGAGAGPF